MESGSGTELFHCRTRVLHVCVWRGSAFCSPFSSISNSCLWSGQLSIKLLWDLRWLSTCRFLLLV